MRDAQSFGRLRRTLQGGFHRACRLAVGDQQVHALPHALQLCEQLSDWRVGVAKQGDQSFAVVCDTQTSQKGLPPVATKGISLRQQARLAQQTSCVRREARVEKMLDPSLGRTRHDGRGQAVAAFHKALCAQVFQVDPNRSDFMGACSPRHKGLWQFAAKAFNPHLRRRHRGQHARIARCVPRVHGHSRPATLQRAGRHPGQRSGVIEPQAHGVAARRQVCGQTPAHTHIAEVINHPAKNIPYIGRGRSVAMKR